MLASLNLAFELSQKEAEFMASSVAHTETMAAASESGSFDNDPLDPQTQTRVEELMRRLDQTLDKDGRLI